MGLSSVPLADEQLDVALWRSRAERAEAQVAELLVDKAGLNARVAELAGQVALLSEQVTTLTGLLFGVSSEKSGSGRQRQEEEAEAAQAPGARPGRPRRGQRPGGAGHGRRDYAHLETEERIIDLGPQQRCCTECGQEFESLGSEDSEQLDWQIKVTRIIWRRRRYRRSCGCGGPALPRTVCAPLPPKPIAKGLFTAGFLARLLHLKHVLGMPIHRIIAMLEAEGAAVSAGGLSGALKGVAPLLRPLSVAIAEHARMSGHAHVDETGWRVFQEVEGKTGHRWWLWTFVTPEASVFVMDPTRSAAVAKQALGIDPDAKALEEGRRLVISSDFYRVYQSLAAIEGVDPLYCWVHIRRYFLRAATAHPQTLGEWAEGWTSRISVLYRAHRALPTTQTGTGEHQRALARFHRAFDDLDARRIEQTLSAERGLMHPAAAKVLATLNNEWDDLARHRDLPLLPLDNNTAERALRTPVVGRKNFYGSGSVWAADLAADIWTITATAAQHDIQPLQLLIDYLEGCAAHQGKPPDDLDPYLPWTPQGRARRTQALDQDIGPAHNHRT